MYTLTDNSITVQTKTKDRVTVYTMPETKYEKSGAAASMTDFKVGNRVVIHATKMSEKLMATECASALQLTRTTKPKTCAPRSIYAKW
jgi:hypothetical protein